MQLVADGPLGPFNLYYPLSLLQPPHHRWFTSVIPLFNWQLFTTWVACQRHPGAIFKQPRSNPVTLKIQETRGPLSEEQILEVLTVQLHSWQIRSGCPAGFCASDKAKGKKSTAPQRGQKVVSQWLFGEENHTCYMDTTSSNMPLNCTGSKSLNNATT